VVTIAAALLLCSPSVAAQPVGRYAGALEITSLKGWTQQKAGAQETWLSPPIDPKMPWTQLVLSWDAELAAGETLELQVRTLTANGASRFYSFGVWSLATQNFTQSAGPRRSLDGQKDGDGEMQTDTLVTSNPSQSFEIQLVGKAASIKKVTISLAGSAGQPPREPDRRAWGKVIEVPRKSQMSYPNGNVICSPTSTTMLLNHWKSPLDVPQAIDGIYDPTWKGTGNWIFNTAFAAAQPGMTGAVLRLNDIRDLEYLISSDLPVATSVSYALLKGKPKSEPGDGHIVVLVGFTKDGDPVFNDPGRSTEIRQIYKRQDFDRAWAASGRTIYLIHPESVKRPKLSIDLPFPSYE
jgi:hypothetical protein